MLTGKLKNRFLRYGVLLVASLLLWPHIAEATLLNALFVMTNKVYVTPINHLETFAIANTISHKIGKCLKSRASSISLADIIQNFDDCYTSHPLPLHIITNILLLPASVLVEGSSRPGESSGDVVTLFGVGYVQSRLFFYGEETESWVISVHAKHDAPAPVLLEIWIDNRQVGNLVFDKGDDTWETLSLVTKVDPGFHNLYVWYANDLFDPEQGLDRNAYISYLQITRQEFDFGEFGTQSK